MLSAKNGKILKGLSKLVKTKLRFTKSVKVPLKAKIVQILFLQIYQNCAKYTIETFTADGIAIAYQIESIA